ncbi:squalene/phytoene synthase family protein [Streptomyces sp. TLI_146]|uniref:squalene/phytoene synthase family protein n=1 Tax=Streptomyces sp. TLI_146 TaxID=1938858 RepID=UPI000C713680|nr:squalene/phytoene synthase family protein [Streptomyces sp. TLI_146]PKV82646.1 phytoene synthase [Streptomyces sp. TLI_146]
MTTWPHTLDRAGITSPVLRDAYSAQRGLVARYARAEYTAVRLLLPAPLVPHVITATAFMHHSDTLIDQGPLHQRLSAHANWSTRTRAALAGSPDHVDPLLAALRHTTLAYPQIRPRISSYLKGGELEASWTSFATEDDFQTYVDAYALPAFMIIASLVTPPHEPDAFEAGCRTFILASQRLDFLEDLAEDLQSGRSGIPDQTLTDHGLTREGLLKRPDPVRMQSLIRHHAALIRRDLAAAAHLEGLVQIPHRPFLRALVQLQSARLAAAESHGPKLLESAPKAPVGRASLILLRAIASRGIHRRIRSTARRQP